MGGYITKTAESMVDKQIEWMKKEQIPENMKQNLELNIRLQESQRRQNEAVELAWRYLRHFFFLFKLKA